MNNYEIQANNMKSTITSLKQRVNSLESQISNIQQPTVASNNDQFQMNTDGAINQTAMPISSPTIDDSTNHIGSIVSTFLNEEKEKSQTTLNLIVHNVNESTSDDGPTRNHMIFTQSLSFSSSNLI